MFDTFKGGGGDKLSYSEEGEKDKDNNSEEEEHDYKKATPQGGH